MGSIVESISPKSYSGRGDDYGISSSKPVSRTSPKASSHSSPKAPSYSSPKVSSSSKTSSYSSPKASSSPKAPSYSSPKASSESVFATNSKNDLNKLKSQINRYVDLLQMIETNKEVLRELELEKRKLEEKIMADPVASQSIEPLKLIASRKK